MTKYEAEPIEIAKHLTVTTTGLISLLKYLFITFSWPDKRPRTEKSLDLWCHVKRADK